MPFTPSAALLQSGGISSGAAFPGSPANNDLYYRTDLDLLFFYDGTRWLTVSKYLAPFPLAASASPGTTYAMQHALYPPLDLWIEAVVWAAVLGATNTGSHYWSCQLTKYDSVSAPTSVGSAFNTSADTASTTVNRVSTIGAALGGTTYKRVIAVWSTTGTPSSLESYANLEYRLIGT